MLLSFPWSRRTIASGICAAGVTTAAVLHNGKDNHKSRHRRPLQVALTMCDDQPSSSLQASSQAFTARLFDETLALLGRHGVALDTSPAQCLANDGSPELAALYRRVEALTLLVDRAVANSSKGGCSLGNTASPPPSEFVSLVCDEYTAFLAELDQVCSSALGPAARPLRETKWWAPLLLRWRYTICSLFSWGLLAPDQVRSVSQVLLGFGVHGIVDPLAGSGWHARLWREAGLMVAALDSYPGRPVAWEHVEVVADSRSVANCGIPLASAVGDDRWALYLSWPPHAPETIGLDLLQLWQGDLVLYLGERDAACCGDAGLTGGRALLDAFEREWGVVQRWRIPTWPGFDDDLTLFRRRKSCSGV